MMVKEQKSLCGISLLLLISMMLSLSIFVSPISAADSSPTRVINLVYDDSGSMIITNNKKVDTWCQAKYAMEVFAAMLGEKDTMNVYVMSRFDSGSSAGPKLTLNGKDGAEKNVHKVHDMITAAGNTPFNSVRKAYADLKNKSAKEKWLVILTDGEFQGVNGRHGIDKFLASKKSDIKVMFLSMGPQGAKITEKKEKNIFFEHAETNDEILTKITNISTRIFNSHKLVVDTSTKDFSIDIPMNELVVFAQGEGVSVTGIKNSAGEEVKPSKKSVSVRFSTKAATNSPYKNPLIAKNLVGSVTTFNSDFVAGDYSINVNKAETIEIYYKPNIEIAAYLKDSDGDEVTELSNLEAGEYTIEFGFVKSGTKEKVAKSKLLGNVTYNATVKNNGTVHDKKYSSGDKIILEEGDLSIDVLASYLDYNTVSTKMNYTIYKNKKIEYSEVELPTYEITKEGLNNPTPIKLKAMIDSKDFTEEQWEMFKIPEVEIASEINFQLGDFIVEKSEEIGIIHITPTLPEGKLADEYSDCNVNVSSREKYGEETWSGKKEVQIKFNDTRSWWDKYCGRIIKFGLIFLALLVMFILWQIWGRRKVFPKKVEIEFNDVGEREIISLNSRSGYTILSTSTFGDVIVGTSTPLTNRFNAKSRRAHFNFVMDHPPKGVQRFTINDSEYVYDSKSKNYVSADDSQPIDFSKKSFKIKNLSTIAWTRVDKGMKKHIHSGVIYINQNERERN